MIYNPTPGGGSSFGSINVKHIDGTYTVYNPASNTDVARGTALRTAVTAGVDGDIVYISNATYDVGANTLDLGIAGTGTISLIGSTNGKTIIKSVVGGTFAEIIRPGISGMTLLNFSMVSSAPVGNFSYPIGLFSGNCLNFTIQNVNINNWSDGIYFDTAGTVTGNIINCAITTGFDTININCSTSSVINLFDNVLHTTFVPGQTNMIRGVACTVGTVNAFNNQIVADGNGPSSNANGVFGYYSDGGIINVYDGYTNAFNAINFFDLEAITGGTINVSAADIYQTYDGNVTFMDTTGILNSLRSSIELFQTPWLQNIDAASFSITDINAISTNNSILDDGSGNMIVGGTLTGNPGNAGQIFSWNSSGGIQSFHIDPTVGTYGSITSGQNTLQDGSDGALYMGTVGFGNNTLKLTSTGDITDVTSSNGSAGNLLTSNGTGSGVTWKSPVAAGTPQVVASADLTAQTAAKTTTTLFTPTTTGVYRVTVYLQVTTPGSVSSILGGSTGVVMTYKDGDGNVTQTDTVGLTAPNGTIVTTLSTNTTATNLSGSIDMYAHSGTAITYAIGYTSAGTAMQYAAHLTCEYMR